MLGAATDLGVVPLDPALAEEERRRRLREQQAVDPRPYGDVTLSTAANELFGKIGL